MSRWRDVHGVNHILVMDSKKKSILTVLSWASFDFANTGFYVIIITLVFPLYFNNVIAGGNESYLGRTISISMLITALLGPLLGSVADVTNQKKMFLAFLTVACILATIGLYFMDQHTFWLAVMLLIVANVGFEGGTVFYDAFLPEVSAPSNYARVSGYGFAFGYLGSFVILLLVLPFIEGQEIGPNVRVTFLIAAAFFALFCLPTFFFVPERHTEKPHDKSVFTAGYVRLLSTLSHLDSNRSVKRFLLAFFFYNDSILTVIYFSSLFAYNVLKLSTQDLVFFFLIVQGCALVGSIAFGLVTNKLGPRQTIAVTLLIWLAVIVGVYFSNTRNAFFALGAIGGVALGSSQSTSRTMMALLTPPEKKTEFFGFYDGFFGKASAIIGPLIFGEVARQLGQRTAILCVGALMSIGLVLLFRVPDVRPPVGERAGQMNDAG